MDISVLPHAPYFALRKVCHGVTVKVTLCVTLPNFAEMVTDLFVVTALVAIGNVVDTVLAGTVTVEGTVAKFVLLLVKLTVAPSDGAGPFKVRVPTACVPPFREVGLNVIELSAAALTAKLAVLAIVPYVADMVTEVLAATGAVVTLNVAVVAFGAIVTLAGTLAAAVLLLPSVTSAPPAGAGPLSVTVPVDEFPPSTDVGVNDTELSVAAFTVKVAVLVTAP